MSLLEIIKEINIPCFPRCEQCGNRIFFLQNRKEDLFRNFKEHAVSIPAFHNLKCVCNSCYKRLLHTTCDRCRKPFPLDEDQSYRYNSEIIGYLRPYAEYLDNCNHLCSNCFNICLDSYIKVDNRIKNWAGNTKQEFLYGFRTVETLGLIVYNEVDLFSKPKDVEERLKLFSAQKGGNAFIKYYFEKHEESEPETVLGGYSKNDNPYYNTIYKRKTWFTGYATAVLVEKKP